MTKKQSTTKHTEVAYPTDDDMEQQNCKLPYQKPTLECYEFVVERGFQDSYEVEQLETMSEITDNPTAGSDGTENYHGEWF